MKKKKERFVIQDYEGNYFMHAVTSDDTCAWSNRRKDAYRFNKLEGWYRAKAICRANGLAPFECIKEVN